MIHNSSVNFKLIHFLLWIKGSHQCPNFETFKCSDQNLSNSTCHFPNHKLVYHQILHHSSVSWNITPLYFFSSNNVCFVQKELINGQIFETCECKTCQTLHVNFETTSNPSSNLASFFIVITHNSFVNSKLIHFLLWIKGSHESPNFETFKCSGENLPYSLCHFPNNKSVFLQILHHFSVSWKITPLYFFRSNVIYFTQKEPIKVELLRILRVQVKIHQILVIFEKTNQFFYEFYIILQCHETQLLYTFLAEILYTFNKRRLLKHKFGKISREQSKVCNFALYFAQIIEGFR